MPTARGPIQRRRGSEEAPRSSSMHEDDLLGVQTQLLASAPIVTDGASEKEDTESPDIRRHHIYYIELITIQIGGDLFHLPSYDFSFLKERYPSATNVDGCAVNLTGVITSISFYRFLLALYPIAREPADYHEWMDAIKLSTLWGFSKIRSQAIKALRPIMTTRTIAESILRAKELRVKVWLIDAYETLAKQDTLTEEELRTPFELDWETIARICLVRLRKPGTTSNSQSMVTVARPSTRCKWCDISSNAVGQLKKRLQCPYTCRNLGLDSDPLAGWQMPEDDDNNLAPSVNWEKKAVQEIFRSELNSMAVE